MDAQAKPGQAELLKHSASGDLAALREMTNRCVSGCYLGLTPLESAIYAEAFGRLAAAHGEDHDCLLLAGILRVRAAQVAELGDINRALALVAQSEAICDDFASIRLSPGAEYLVGVLTAWIEIGDELAAVRLDWLTAALSAGDADKLRCDVNEACRSLRVEAVAHG